MHNFTPQKLTTKDHHGLFEIRVRDLSPNAQESNMGDCNPLEFPGQLCNAGHFRLTFGVAFLSLDPYRYHQKGEGFNGFFLNITRVTQQELRIILDCIN